MKNFLKKKSKDVSAPQADAQTDPTTGLGKSPQNFLSKFKKKGKSGSDEAKSRLRGSSHSSSTADPYAPPSAINKVSSSGGVNTSTWYDIHGRIGRVQFLAFNMIWSLFIALLAFLAGLLAGGLSTISTGAIGIVPIVILLALIPVLAFSYFILPKRRLNDLGHTGWFSLIIFVPLVNIAYLLYLIFAKGQQGVNQYGEPPAPYTKVQMILASIYPIFLIAGLGLSIASMFMAPDVDSLDMETLPTDTVVENTDVTEDSAGDVTLTETDESMAEGDVTNPDTGTVDTVAEEGNMDNTNVSDEKVAASDNTNDGSDVDTANTTNEPAQDDTTAQIDAALSKVPEISLEEFEELSSRPLFRDTSKQSNASEDSQ